MFSLFKGNPIKKVMFEDIQFSIKNSGDFLLINTMFTNEQDCLIKHTLPYHMEEKVINDLLSQYSFEKRIIVYGKNANDDTCEKKYNQLTGLGFANVYIYMGGLFEWMLLQDIYGRDEFPTTSKVLDILKFKPMRTINGPYLTL
jgi:hypothetical protein